MRSPAFWRNLAVYFCAFSVAGHWMEIAYCSFMDLFGIVDDDSLVWGDPFYPFLVYGVGVAVCAIALVPLKERLLARRRSTACAAAQFFLITVGVCLVMELAMGLMLNQPNLAGEYPLWDNSALPFNVLGQAWLVNDLALGAVAMLYAWAIYPASEKLLAKVPPRIMNAAAALTVAAFVVLCIVKFA
nr:putative ABC transporter permease [Eggerthella hominis]